MAKWKKTVDIKKLLNSEGRTDRECALNVVDLLRHHPEFADYEHGDLLYDMEAAAEDANVEEFDYLLNQVYDIADRELIWMGI